MYVLRAKWETISEQIITTQSDRMSFFIREEVFSDNNYCQLFVRKNGESLQTQFQSRFEPKA